MTDQFIAQCVLYISLAALAIGVIGLYVTRPRRQPKYRDPHAGDCGVRTRGICDCGYWNIPTRQHLPPRPPKYIRDIRARAARLMLDAQFDVWKAEALRGGK